MTSGKGRRRHVVVFDDLYKDLAQLGTVNDSYDDVIRKLLKHYKNGGGLQ